MLFLLFNSLPKLISYLVRFVQSIIQHLDALQQTYTVLQPQPLLPSTSPPTSLAYSPLHPSSIHKGKNSLNNAFRHVNTYAVLQSNTLHLPVTPSTQQPNEPTP